MRRPLAAFVALFALGIARLVLGDPFGQAALDAPPQLDAPSAEALAVLAGLAPGDEVAGVPVSRVGGPAEGRLVVELSDGQSGLRVWVARRGAAPAEPPARTERFDVFFGPPVPPLRSLGEADALRVVEALTQRIEEGGADVPPSM